VLVLFDLILLELKMAFATSRLMRGEGVGSCDAPQHHWFLLNVFGFENLFAVFDESVGGS
jgi:hypothetical protein